MIKRHGVLTTLIRRPNKPVRRKVVKKKDKLVKTKPIEVIVVNEAPEPLPVEEPIEIEPEIEIKEEPKLIEEPEVIEEEIEKPVAPPPPPEPKKLKKKRKYTKRSKYWNDQK